MALWKFSPSRPSISPGEKWARSNSTSALTMSERSFSFAAFGAARSIEFWIFVETLGAVAPAAAAKRQMNKAATSVQVIGRETPTTAVHVAFRTLRGPRVRASESAFGGVIVIPAIPPQKSRGGVKLRTSKRGCRGLRRGLPLPPSGYSMQRPRDFRQRGLSGREMLRTCGRSDQGRLSSGTT